MTTRRLIRKKSCTGKKQHATKAEAVAEVARLKAAGSRAGHLNAYPCRFGDHWHVGRRPRRKPTGRRTR